MRKLVAVLAVTLTAGAVALSADLFRLAGLSLYTEQYLAALMASTRPVLDPQTRSMLRWGTFFSIHTRFQRDA